LLHALCIFLGASLLLLQFSFALFAAINGWITLCLFWRETYSVFHCQEHSSFHSYRSTSILFFSNCIYLSFFALTFVQILLYICIKVYLDH
jgi:hypothetical protein